MRTLADFKRALTLGSKWKIHYHPLHEYRGEREIVKVTKEYVAFKPEGSDIITYLDFPPATHIKFNEDGGVDIYAKRVNETHAPMKEAGILLLTLRKVA